MNSATRACVAVVLALAAPILFPAALALIIVALASVVVPPVGLLAGVLADGLYATPVVGVPYATLVGLALSVLGYAVHRFIKTRIMAL
jgi:hypothetical protein